MVPTPLHHRCLALTGVGVFLLSTLAQATKRPDPIPTPTFSQQTAFQNGGTANFGTGAAFDSLGNVTSTLDGGVSEGQGDGPGFLRATLDPSDKRWQIFTTYDFGVLDIEGDGGIQSRTDGGSVGVLYRACSNFAFGGSVGGLHSVGHMAGGSGGVTSDGLTLAAFGVATFGNTFVDLLYSATLLDSDFTRQTGGANATGQAGSTVQTIATTIGHNLRYGRWVTTPRLGLNYSHWSQDGYAENGNGALLEYPNQNSESLITRVEWFNSYDIKTSFGLVTPRALVGWHRETMGGVGASNVGVVGGGVAAGAGGSNRVRHYMVAGAGVALTLGNNWKASADYLGQFFGGSFEVHNVSVMLSYGF